MGAHVHGGTIPGGLTPICNSCGISLCWDISQVDYEEAKSFWDNWKCEECNDGVRMSLRSWLIGKNKVKTDTQGEYNAPS